MGGGGGGDERAAAPAPQALPRPSRAPALARRACLRRRSARVRATAAAEPSSPRRGHGGRRRAGRLPPALPGRPPGPRRRRWPPQEVPVQAGETRVRAGRKSWRADVGTALKPRAARRGAAREDARAPSPAAAPAPPRRRLFPLPWKQIGGRRGRSRAGAAARECGVGTWGRASRRQA
ncbi:synapsin-1-like [Prionailurus bengalensis]|uniref:synapsin-1-like n=1 Tax=Prionailurus bengalensis TaxID=37029 RepID=UPI00090593C7|nr:synapsin-1-like [Prionailurus bengalensis]XP_043419650.1 synapsin-1-like [Prionailurus bengalensis]